MAPHGRLVLPASVVMLCLRCHVVRAFSSRPFTTQIATEGRLVTSSSLTRSASALALLPQRIHDDATDAGVLGRRLRWHEHHTNSQRNTPTRRFSSSNTQPPAVAAAAKAATTKGWNQLGLVSELLDAVALLELERPTEVQQLVIPQLLQSQSLAFLSATGSGKTLAYCLPLLQRLKSHEQFDMYVPRPQRPRLVVVAPTRELVAQIHSVVKTLCHSIKLSSAALLGGEDAGKQRKRLSGPVDIVVSTPGRLLKHWTAGHVFLGEITHVVVDEMDTMLEQGFEDDLKRILYPVLYRKQPKQIVDLAADYTNSSPRLVMTSATLTQAVQRLVGDTSSLVSAKRHYRSAEPAAQESSAAAAASSRRLVLPQLRVVQAPGLHRAVPTLKQTFLSVGTEDKLNLLVDQVLSAQNRAEFSSSATSAPSNTAATATATAAANGLTMIFCNTAASCRAVQYALLESGVPSLACHGELNSAMRMEQLTQFRKAGAELARGGGSSRGRKGDDVVDEDDEIPRILVCTDLVARGLDVPQVSRVIMFDFPLNALDYLHRIGRTARASNAGWVTSLVTKRDQVLASAIQGAVQRGEPLDGLSSRKSDYLPGGRLHQSRAGGATTGRRKAAATEGSRSRTVGSRRSSPSSGGSTRSRLDGLSRRQSDNSPGGRPHQSRAAGGSTTGRKASAAEGDRPRSAGSTRSGPSGGSTRSTPSTGGRAAGPLKAKGVGARKGRDSQVAGRSTTRAVGRKDAGSRSTGNSRSR